MDNIILRPGIELVEIHEVYLLVADRQARKHCHYVRRINNVGASIWTALKSNTDLNEIERIIRNEYEIPEDYDLEADILNFVDILKQHQYVIEIDETSSLNI